MESKFNVTVEYLLDGERITETIEVKAIDDIDAEDAAYSRLLKRLPHAKGIDFLDVAEVA
jgi:hypothetical protein